MQAILTLDYTVFYLMKQGDIIGVCTIREENAHFVPFSQTDPFGTIARLDDLKSESKNMAEQNVRSFFQNQMIAIQTMPEVITHVQYRERMWDLFKKRIIPKIILEEIKKRAADIKPRDAGRRTKHEIAVLYLMNPIHQNQALTDLWEKWLQAWWLQKK